MVIEKTNKEHHDETFNPVAIHCAAQGGSILPAAQTTRV
jgi:hypothetical protein